MIAHGIYVAFSLWIFSARMHSLTWPLTEAVMQKKPAHHNRLFNQI